MKKKLPNINILKPAHLFASTFGVGLMRPAPGTWGTLAAIPFYFLMRDLSLLNYCLLTAVLFAFGVWVSAITMRDLKVYDHPQIVIDETVGYFITMIAMPHHWIWIIAGFLLFRFFDILKPWPIYIADEKIESGFGIMFDDLLAAIYSWVALRIIILVLLHFRIIL